MKGAVAAKTSEVRTSPRSYDPAWAQAVKWRTIGPTAMGGRVVALAVAESDPTVWYVASASGGLFKTVNCGTTFAPVFEREATISIGDVAVSATNPDIVWVGTGEQNARNSASWGDGVYKSTDGGKTWTNMGLRGSFQIGRVLIHPKNPDIVYVGALGRLWGENDERGVFKTVDGGKSWEKVLYIDAKTGCIEMQMSPADPDTLLAATYERLRDNTDDNDPIKRFGPGTGLFKTSDAGRTWRKVTAGLPTCLLGRIGLSYYQKDPKVVYAIVESERSGTNPAAKAAPTSGSAAKAPPAGTATKAAPAASGAKTPPTSSAAKAPPNTEQKAPRETKETIVPSFPPPRAGNPAPQPPVTATIKSAAPPASAKAPPATAPKAAAPVAAAQPPAAGQTPPRRGPRQSGYMGIQGENDPAGAQLTAIVEGGPAEKAGLKADDVVIAVGGKKVASYDAFVEFLGESAAGDQLALSVQRGKEKVEIKVTLEPRAGGAGGGGGAPPGFPFGTRLGGQVANRQDQQGPEGYQTGGIYRSADGGETWTRINSLNPRPFYFSKIFVDPQDEKNIYVLGIAIAMSTDGGKTFEAGDAGRGVVHADQHAMWIDPKDSRHMIVGCDGGLSVSHDRTRTWEFLGHIPMAQFYHVAVDTRKPYRVYGGLQDNQSWGGPSATRTRNGPSNQDWINLGGGDGFVCQVDPNDPDLVYYESQNGAMTRVHLTKGEQARIAPAPGGNRRHRFNWKTPFILSSHNSRIFYAASNYVLRSLDRGSNLQTISPEITKTNKGTATAIAESPLDPNVLYVGSDDGALFMTQNGGQTWTDIRPNVKDLAPALAWVDSIECSRTVPGRVYVAFDAHRANNDEPFPLVSEDFGKTWKSIRANLPSGSTRCLREDRVNPEALYCGTEFGLWVSIDRGKDWTKLTGLPTVAVHDVGQPTTAEEIVAATHGRGMWIAEVSPVRQATPKILAEGAYLFKPAPAVLWNPRLGTQIYGTRRPTGENPISDAVFYFSLRSKVNGATLKVLDADGKSVREITAPKEPGLHRVTWDRRRQGTVGNLFGFGQVAGMEGAPPAAAEGGA
ncbi:MAG TPA: PDZ domain-containing protein, partial [Planctomycetia bacterium]|nr:PDZ domain-containing protein [Planctomycetia bacterium]